MCSLNEKIERTEKELDVGFYDEAVRELTGKLSHVLKRRGYNLTKMIVTPVTHRQPPIPILVRGSE